MASAACQDSEHGTCLQSNPEASDFGPAVVTLPDEIDVTNVGVVAHELSQALEDGAGILVADGTAVSFCGSAGATALMLAHRQAAARGSEFRVIASPAMLRILELTDADGVLDTHTTLAGALAERHDT